MKDSLEELVISEELEPIAIIGLAFEFPQEATSEDAFWQMICEGRSASTDFPKERLNIDAFYHPDVSRNSTLPVRGGNFVKEDLGAFDAPFFSIAPGEASCMDPQHRRMLETAYLALEDSGIPLDKCSGSDTSVYTGCFTNDYLSVLQQDYEAEQRHAVMGVAPSMLANRVSWFFNFKGTSMNLDSACSSSLVALHLACQDLRAGTASMVGDKIAFARWNVGLPTQALVGGANMVYHPDFMKMMTTFNFLSPDSRSWSFDERANGYARGEGTAVIVIKRLTDALRDGDTLRSIIRNTGTNQDGKTPGITQPSQEAQADLIKRTYKQANLDMGPTRFFEAHGTGTKVGDPAEANAIGQAFRRYRTADDPLYIGAVKANIGHLEGCSGLAGIIKALLTLEKGLIPPIAGFKCLNSNINATALHIHVSIMKAIVNSFGFGGTNATVILDDAYHFLELNGLQGYHRTSHISTRAVSIVEDHHNLDKGLQPIGLQNGPMPVIDRMQRKEVSAAPQLLVWSSSEQTSALKLTEAYCEQLSQHKLQIDELAHALASRRTHFVWRNSVVVDGQDPDSFEHITPTKAVRSIKSPQLAFVFTGQGASYVEMGCELVIYSAFCRSLQESQVILEELGCSWSLRAIIDGTNATAPIGEPQYSQPATTCLQIALIDLLRSWGIRPSVVLGHSSGEIAASYAAGALSLAAAIRAAYFRGIISSRIVQDSVKMTMMAVGISRLGVTPYLERLQQTEGSLRVQIGCVNSPRSVTLTGEVEQLTKLENWFKEDSIFARRLLVPVAYHSSFMDSISTDYQATLGELQTTTSSGFVPMISSVTGDFIAAETLRDPRYWVRNMTSTVEFEAAVSKLIAYSNTGPRQRLGKTVASQSWITHMVEIGPHSTLQGPIRDILQSSTQPKIPSYVSVLTRKMSASISILKAVGSLFCAGYPVNIPAANNFHSSTKPIPSGLPRYPFNHKQSYWLESRLSKNFRFREASRHDLLGTRSLDWNPLVAQWRNVIRLSEVPWLQDHKINGEVIFPAAGMVVTAVEALKQVTANPDGIKGIQLKDVDFLRPIIFPRETERAETQLSIETPSGTSPFASWSEFRLFVVDNNDYSECCHGFIRAVSSTDDFPAPSFMHGRSILDWVENLSNLCQGSEHDPYCSSAKTSIQYGPCFQNVERMRLGYQGEVTAEVKTTSWKSRAVNTFAQHFTVHPIILDGMAQLLVPALAYGKKYLPTMVPAHADLIGIDCGNIELLEREYIRATAKCSFRGYRGASADIVATSTDSQRQIIYIQGLETTFINSTGVSEENTSSSRTLCTRLTWKPDIDLLNNTQLFLNCTTHRPPEAVDAVARSRLQTIALMSFIEEAVDYVQRNPSLTLKPHMTAYVDWMRNQLQLLRNRHLTVTDEMVQEVLKDSHGRAELLAKVEAFGDADFFLIHIGRNLIQVLCGELDPLELFFKNGLADRYYKEMLTNEHFCHPASAYVDLLCFKDPSMTILEVGAGTGGQTQRILETLASDGVNKWSRYDYTDISPGFFESARAKFNDHLNRMDFKVLDISQDPISQSFEAESYDLVIASFVLHAIDDLNKALRNIRKLLKTGGRLLLFEATRPESLHIGFAFGVLRDWWAPLKFESRSPHSPCLISRDWEERLKETSFSGVDVEINGQSQTEIQYSSIMISTAIGDGDWEESSSPEIAVLINQDREDQLSFATLLKSRYDNCKIYSLAELAGLNAPSSGIIVSVLEFHAKILHGISATNYENLHKVLARSKNTIWVTKSISGVIEPDHHLADGLGRVLASEDPIRKFVTLTLDAVGEESQAVDLLMRIISRVNALSVEELETNVVSSTTGPQISRITSNSHMDQVIAKVNLPQQIEERYVNGEDSLSLRIEHPGHLETLGWFSGETLPANTYLNDDDVHIEVSAFGLTFRDFLISSGSHNEIGFGMESAGTVRASGIDSGFHSGDRVCVLGSSIAKSILRASAAAVYLIPPDISFAEAASIPVSMWLAYHSIVDLARLEEGDTVLIYQATSSTGQMILQLAREKGAQVLATANSLSKCKHLVNILDLPEESILYPEDASLTNKIYHLTQGRGVDVIVGPVLNHSPVDFTECLSTSGHLIDITLTDRAKSRRVPPAGTTTNMSLSYVNMASLLESQPKQAYRTFQNAMGEFFRLKLKNTLSLDVFPPSQAKEAFLKFQDRSLIAKKIIELHPGDRLLVSISTHSSASNILY
ncbi:Lovastatin diketide synthase [Lachnellula hyalina]|uniref:Lovastatin diketide synthase n=1 Tax=Lachnellula hyalina TaxID=1316788 RepID=A0A8H8R9W9_9HELO|nr:Lovastatin diketide synthase [Lachnellula hyalina]TVY30663.1 Lovastatin diketide synthase [Lachnellula hyalina]